jgi:hypothetical protein
MDFINVLNTFTTSFYSEGDDVESANVILIDSQIRDFMMGDDNSTGDFVFVTESSNLWENFESNWTLADQTTTSRNNENLYRDPLSIILPISVIYIIIFIAGILGNAITCVVIATNKTMHTATNYYLFNLAVSDSLILLVGESNLKIIFELKFRHRTTFPLINFSVRL